MSYLLFAYMDISINYKNSQTKKNECVLLWRTWYSQGFFSLWTCCDALKYWHHQGAKDFTRYVSNLKTKNVFRFSSFLPTNSWKDHTYLVPCQFLFGPEKQQNTAIFIVGQLLEISKSQVPYNSNISLDRK